MKKASKNDFSKSSQTKYPFRIKFQSSEIKKKLSEDPKNELKTSIDSIYQSFKNKAPFYKRSKTNLEEKKTDSKYSVSLEKTNMQ